MSTYLTPSGWRQSWAADDFPEVFVSTWLNPGSGFTAPYQSVPIPVSGTSKASPLGSNEQDLAHAITLRPNEVILMSCWHYDNYINGVFVGYSGSFSTANLRVEYYSKFDGGDEYEAITGGGFIPFYTPASPVVRGPITTASPNPPLNYRLYDTSVQPPVLSTPMPGQSGPKLWYPCVGLRNTGSTNMTITNLHIYTNLESGSVPTVGLPPWIVAKTTRPPVVTQVDPIHLTSATAAALVRDFADALPESAEDRGLAVYPTRKVQQLTITVEPIFYPNGDYPSPDLARTFLLSQDGVNFTDSLVLKNLIVGHIQPVLLRRVTPLVADSGPISFRFRMIADGDPYGANPDSSMHFVPFTYNVNNTSTAQPVPQLWHAIPSAGFAGGTISVEGAGFPQNRTSAVRIRGRTLAATRDLTVSNWQSVYDDAVTPPALENLEHFTADALLDPALDPGIDSTGDLVAISSAAAVPASSYETILASYSPFWWFKFTEAHGDTTLANTATPAYGLTFAAGDFAPWPDLTSHIGSSGYSISAMDMPCSNNGVSQQYLAPGTTKWYGYWVCGLFYMPFSVGGEGYRYIWYHSGAFEVYLFDGKLACTLTTTLGTYTVVSETSPVADGLPHHFAVVYDGCRLRLTVDGSLVAWRWAFGQVNVSTSGSDQYGLPRIQLGHRDDETSFGGGVLQEIAAGPGILGSQPGGPLTLDLGRIRTLYQAAFNTTDQPSNAVALAMSPINQVDSSPDPVTLSTTLRRGLHVYTPTGPEETPLKQHYAFYTRDRAIVVNGQPRKLPLYGTARSFATVTPEEVTATNELAGAMDINLGADARWLANPSTVVPRPTIGADVTHWNPSQGGSYHWQFHLATQPTLDVGYEYFSRDGLMEVPAMVFDGSGWGQLVKPDGSSPGSAGEFTFALVAQIRGNTRSRFHDLIAAPSDDNADPRMGQRATMRADLDHMKVQVTQDVIDERLHLFGATDKHKLMQYRPSIFIWSAGPKVNRLGILDAHGYRHHVEVFGPVFRWVWLTINQGFYLGRAGSTPDLTYAAHMDVLDLAYWQSELSDEQMHKVAKKLDGVWGVHK